MSTTLHQTPFREEGPPWKQCWTGYQPLRTNYSPPAVSGTGMFFSASAASAADTLELSSWTVLFLLGGGTGGAPFGGKAQPWTVGGT